MTLDLEPTIDILAELGAKKGSRIVVGFAAETNDVLANARKKLESKSLDAIVLNDVSQPGIGFDSERNAVTILTHAGAETVPETSKWEVAHRVLDAVVKMKAERKDSFRATLNFAVATCCKLFFHAQASRSANQETSCRPREILQRDGHSRFLSPANRSER